eukprot:gene4122-4368_t
MGTGSVALSIAAFPFKFTGQAEIGLAVWSFNALLFALFSLLMLGRLLLFTATIPKLFNHPNQSLFCGALPMAFSTITNGVVAFLVPRCGESAAAATHAMFWINLPLVLCCILYIPFAMAIKHEHGINTMTALWLLPVVPACVAANTAGVVSIHMASASNAIVVLYIGVCLLGIGFLLSYQICATYYQRLIVHNLPAREMIISSFLPVGPMAMTAWAVMNLSISGTQHLVDYAQLYPQHGVDPIWLSEVLPISLGIAGVVGMFLWAFATWWLLVAVFSVCSVLRQGIPFNLGWWGAVFPLGVYTAVQQQYDSAAIHDIAEDACKIEIKSTGVQ